MPINSQKSYWVVTPGLRYLCRIAAFFLICVAVGLLSECGCSSASSASTGQTASSGVPMTSVPVPSKSSNASITNVDPFATFTWTAVTPTPDYYYLSIGTAPYRNDVYYSDAIPNTQTSVQPWGLLGDGSTYYATFSSVVGGDYNNTEFSFTTARTRPSFTSSDLYSQVDALTKQVREMTAGPAGAPSPGTLLAKVAAGRGHFGGADCVDYSLSLITLMLQKRINARRRSSSLDGNYWEGHTMTEYWDPFAGKWSVADATFGVVYFDDAKRQGQSVEDLHRVFSSGNYQQAFMRFVSSYGDYEYRYYYVDGLSLYLNPVDPLGGRPSPINNDPHSYLTLRSQADVEGIGGTYIFEFANPNDSVTIADVSGYVTLTPIPASLKGKTLLFGHAYTFYNGWFFSSVPRGMKVYTFPVFWTNTSTLLYPADQSTDVDPSVRVVFRWTEIKDAQAYTLYVGSSLGGDDVYNSGEVSATTLPVTLQTQTKYYVRIWSKASDGSSYHRDSSFQTGYGVARLTSPPDGATNVPAGLVSFTWTDVSDAISYTLWVGTTWQGHDVYCGYPTTMTSASVTLQPGTRYWVHLWTRKSSGWTPADTKFQTQ